MLFITYFLNTKKLHLAKVEIKALINNYPSKWICPKLTMALGNMSNNRTAGNQAGLRARGKGDFPSQSGDAFYPGDFGFEGRIGSE